LNLDEKGKLKSNLAFGMGNLTVDKECYEMLIYTMATNIDFLEQESLDRKKSIAQKIYEASSFEFLLSK
jgi:hypothetical protein